MDNLKELRTFLIKKFLRTVLVVSVAEIILFTLLSRTVKPFVLHYFFNDADLGTLSLLGIFAVILLVLLTLIIELLKLIIPGRVGSALVDLASYSNFLSQRVSRSNDISVAGMGRIKETLLFIILLFSIIIILLPILLAAVHFARVIIKELKKIEDAEKEKQREYERKRNLMLSDIAHDLRTPMTTVSGYARALSDGVVKDEDKKKEYLDAIRAKSERMNELITFLFDYVKTDSEGFELHKENADICELVRETVAVLYQDAVDAGMELDIDIPEEKIVSEVDKLQLSRVITNLVTNAIKHNKKNTSIGIIVERNDDLKIMICDNGGKIDDDAAEHIFEPFYTGDESRNSKGGTGLGLSIAKKIISLHDFKIKLIQSPIIKKYDKAAGYLKMFMISIPGDKIKES